MIYWAIQNIPVVAGAVVTLVLAGIAGVVYVYRRSS